MRAVRSVCTAGLAGLLASQPLAGQQVTAPVGAMPVPIVAPFSAPAGQASGRAREWVLLPFVYYTPETDFAGGVSVGHYPGGGLAARPSSVLTTLTLTTRRQIIAEAVPELYIAGGRVWVYGRAVARDYPDVFYGIGRAAPEDAEEGFTSRLLELELQAQRAVGAGTWLGVRTRVRAEDVRDIEPDGILAGGTVRGARGGSAVGLGVVATRDTRDRTIAPRAGTYGQARWTGFARALGSDDDFGLLAVEARRYGVAGPGVLVVRGTVEAAHGGAPFTMQPMLGGARRLRGYREGRFRDDLAGTLETEYRFPIAWRLGGVVFAGAGTVAPALDDLPRLADVERAAGAGLRFRLNDAGVNIRVDWGRGRGTGGLYLGLGEAF